MRVTPEIILAVMPHAGDVAQTWAQSLTDAMLAYGIDNNARAAMFLAQVAHESQELTHLEENLHYSAQGLMRTFGKHFTDLAQAQHYADLGPEAIASHVYASRLGNGPEESGDGWTFRGRGVGGLTFKANYMAFSAAAVGDSQTLLDHPELVAGPDFGAASYAWFWDSHKINQYADVGDFDGVCDATNIGRKTIAVGDSNGYADRVSYWHRAIKAFM